MIWFSDSSRCSFATSFAWYASSGNQTASHHLKSVYLRQIDILFQFIFRGNSQWIIQSRFIVCTQCPSTKYVNLLNVDSIRMLVKLLSVSSSVVPLEDNASNQPAMPSFMKSSQFAAMQPPWADPSGKRARFIDEQSPVAAPNYAPWRDNSVREYNFEEIFRDFGSPGQFCALPNSVVTSEDIRSVNQIWNA